METAAETTSVVREITIAASPETVWQFLVDPDKAIRWMGQAAWFDPRPGGQYRIQVLPGNTASGEFVELDPPRRLVYTWGTDELHFQLEPTDIGGCTLTFVNVLGVRDAAARNAAGWTVCLAELDKHVSGAVADGPHSATAEPWQPYYDEYVAAGMPSGAPIPGIREGADS